MKREGISTLFICSYLRALSCLLLFENVLVVGVSLKVFWKRICNDSRLYKNAYKVLVLKLVQRGVCDMCFWKWFWKCVFFVMVLVFIRTHTKCLSFENVSKWKCSVYEMFLLWASEQLESFYLLKGSLVLFSSSFRCFYLTICLVRSPIVGCEGMCVGRLYSHRRHHTGRFSNVV